MYSITTPRLRCCRLPGKLGWMQPSSLLGTLRVLTALARARRERLMPPEKLWLLSWIAVRSRSWTSGATESSNMVLHHFAQTLGSTAEIWISSTEHPCVLSGARHYFPAGIASSQLDGRGLSIWTG